MRVPWLSFVLALTACEKSGPAADPAQAAPTDATRAVAAPADATLAAAPGSGCVVQLGLIVTPDGGRYRVVATATNAGAATERIELGDRCPGQAIALLGLPAGHDPDETCNKGACAPGRATRAKEIALPPGETTELAAWTIDPGKTTCNAPLAAGRYDLSFEGGVLITSAASCGPGTATFEIAPATTAPKPRPKPRPATPTTATQDAGPYRCPRMPACGIGCPGAMAKDEHGCTLCACEKDDLLGRPARGRP